ncbi:MAG TPA: TonB-dependent receptor [Flavitalea sp.]|nr:TonB-dependent receptor [Flavitalea sp.]
MRTKIYLMALLLSFSCFEISMAAYSQRVTFQKQNASLEEVFSEIQRQTGLSFLYTQEMLKGTKLVNVNYRNTPVIKALDECMAGQSLSYVIDKTTIVIRRVSVVQSPKVVTPPVRIVGKVTDNKEQPLRGVSVTIKGTNNGVTTDDNGAFSIEVKDRNETLVFSYVGFNTMDVPINGRSDISITLTEKPSTLNETVVIGYGTARRANLTGSVSTIKAKDLSAASMPSIGQAMMGRTTGVFVKNVNGQPGENKVSFNIRGFGPPLLIIDGLPASTNDFNQLDPNDIESFSVLKDAAAAAVYGAAAGNGVILVTTKRGSSGDAKISYTGNYGLQFFLVMPDLVSSEEYARMENVSRFNQGLDPIWTDEQLQKFKDGSDPLKYPNTDWIDRTLRKYAPQMEHNISVQGGSEKVKYFVSGGYFLQEGLERNSETKSKRYTLRSNIDIRATKRLNIGINLSLLSQNYFGSVVQLERSRAAFGIMGTLFRSRPYFLESYPDPTKYSGDAPYILSNTSLTGFKTWSQLAGDAKLNFSYDLPFGIQAKANYHLYRQYAQIKEKREKTPLYDYDANTDQYSFRKYTNDPNSLIQRSATGNNFDQQYFLTWRKTFNNHTINALTVYEILSYDSNYIQASRMRYNYDIDYLFAGPDLDKNNNGSAYEGGRKGWITRLNYDYKGKYLVEFNSRLDASPKFPKNTRWGFFPSVSAAWNITKEGFMEKLLPTLSTLKLRASVGKLGYDNVGNFQYLQTYSINSQYIYDGATNVIDRGIGANALANPSITWEKMTTSNVGVDFSLWGNLLEGSIDYFYRRRTDVLGTRIQSLPSTVGANLPSVNYAKYDNRGLELLLNHNNRIGEVFYSIGGNISWNREKSLLVDQTLFSNEEGARTGNRVGQWTDVAWGKKTAGLFKSKEEIENWADQDGRNNASILPGDLKIVDYNGDGRITAEDNVIIGRGTFPKLTYGINMSVSWKGFNFSMLWQGAGMYDIFLLNSPDLTLPFYAGNTPITSMLHESYIPENPWVPANTGANAKRPLFRTDNYNREHPSFTWDYSDFWLISGAYIRLKQMELGYTLPQNLTRKVGMDRLKIYVAGFNLLTFSAVDYLDPEADTSPALDFGLYYPPVGTYSAGIQLQF